MIFEQLALALKNRVAQEMLHCIEIFFIIQDFWATSAYPEKQSLPWNFSSRGTASPPASYAYADN